MPRSALCHAFEHTPLLPDFSVVTLIAITSARLLLNAYFTILGGERWTGRAQNRLNAGTGVPVLDHGHSTAPSILSFYEDLFMDTVFTIVCLISQTVCLGLVFYVIRGWRKRMQNTPAEVTHGSERVET